ncbi:hypothetical protein GEMRC1_012867 [Eukaryota sp. GEM-RC1]
MCYSLNNMKEETMLNLSKFDISSVTDDIFVMPILIPDSHFVIECHLPNKVFLSDVEHVILPKTTDATLSDRAKHALEELSKAKENFFIQTECLESTDYTYMQKMVLATCSQLEV